jgi:flagellar hook-associated protein 2
MGAIDGLISGLNTTQIISQLMQVERLPEQQLTNHKTASQTLVNTMQGLNSLFTALQTAANVFVPDSITKQSAWGSTTGTSSAPTLAGVTTGPTAQPGSARFTVNSVASAGSAVSAKTVGALTSPVAAGPFLLTKGASGLGLSAVDAGAGLATGSHTVTVTQASAAATLTGQNVLPPAVTIDGTNNTVSFFVDGATTPTSVTLTQGVYSPTQLAVELGRASGGVLAGGVDSRGNLTVSSTREGSSASLQVAAPNPALGLTDTTAKAVGADGKIKLDGGPEQTLSSITAGQPLTLTGGTATDTVTATVSAGLRLGTATTTSVDVPDRATLSDVARAISTSSAGVNATAVGVSSTAFRLQLTSTTTGSASDISVSGGGLDTALGSMQVLNAGTDTVLRVGTGPGAFDVTSSTNTVTGLLPGVTITALKADPSTQVAVNVSSDSNGMADKMAALVVAANAALAYIDKQSAYDADSKRGGPLLGDSMARDLRQQVTDAAIGSSTSTPALSGVSVGRDGTVTFDKAAFLTAYGKDPAAVAATLTAMSKQLADVAKNASDPTRGAITTRITNEQDNIRDYTKQIADFEDRMTLRQQTLQTQYAALETMLGKLQSQSQWLAGQLGSLPTTSSSK